MTGSQIACLEWMFAQRRMLGVIEHNINHYYESAENIQLHLDKLNKFLSSSFILFLGNFSSDLIKGIIIETNFENQNKKCFDLKNFIILSF
jgi:hypothetical protein